MNRRGSRGTKDQLLIDKTILRNYRKAKRNLAIGFKDYKKAYDIVHDSWLEETLNIVGVADNINQLLGQSISKWKTVLPSNGDTLRKIFIQSRIFQGDSLSSLLLIIILIPLSMNSTNYGYLLSKETPINQLLFMDDLKIYSKTERELQSLVHTVQMISKDISMEFGMDKCSTVRIKKGKVCDMEDNEMPDGQQMKQIEESGYKYLAIIQGREIKTQVIKDNISG